MTDRKDWQLGQTSHLFESGGGGPGTVSTGVGDRGGVSYGTYQMSSSVGVVGEYLKASAYRDNFKDMEINSPEFIAEWKRLAAEGPGFGVDQHDFIQNKYYEPTRKSLLRNELDLDARGEAVKDMVWSTAVQYGPGATVGKLMDRGLQEAYGQDYRIDELSDSQVVRAVQESKLTHVATDFASSPRNTPGIETRIEVERFALAHLAEDGTPLTSQQIATYHRAVQPLQVGSRGERVASLQRDLGDLGYLSRAGVAPDPDGQFGKGTEEALKAFQRSSGLLPLGLAAPLTQRTLQEQVQARDLGLDHLRANATAMPTCALDDTSHPDHRMYAATRVLVHDLDRSHGRTPDERSDNLAAALVVAARQSGLERVDQIALSDDASQLWGAQRPPGARDHFFDRLASTDTVQGLNTPISDSSNRWPEAMQAYESIRQTEQQALQQTREQLQSQSQSQSHQGPSMVHGL